MRVPPRHRSVLLLLCLTTAAGAQRPGGLAGAASARWIADTTSSPTDYGVYHFRRALDLPAVPARLLVYVSADNHYRILVNGCAVA